MVALECPGNVSYFRIFGLPCRAEFFALAVRLAVNLALAVNHLSLLMGGVSQTVSYDR